MLVAPFPCPFNTFDAPLVPGLAPGPGLGLGPGLGAEEGGSVRSSHTLLRPPTPRTGSWYLRVMKRGYKEVGKRDELFRGVGMWQGVWICMWYEV